MIDLHILPDADVVAREAAAMIVAEARAAVAARGRFVLALSGGRTPWIMLNHLAHADGPSDGGMPWDNVQLLQVDERVAPDGHPDRNWTHIQESLLDHVPLKAEQVHPMPVNARDLAQGCRDYADILVSLCGAPPVIDLVHLGLGDDGHTASLVPGSAALDVTDRYVSPSGIYQGRERVTLTYPVLNAARKILWVVTGSEKASPFQKLLAADPSIPAGRVVQDHAVALADRLAAN
jgi:6-phosphogluconolactonase